MDFTTRPVSLGRGRSYAPGVTHGNVTREQWTRLHAAVENRYRWAFSLCQWVVNELAADDPLYHYSGALLEACIGLRKVAAAGRDGSAMPIVSQARSMMAFVSPHTGGGVVPQKLKERRGRGRRRGCPLTFPAQGRTDGATPPS